MDYTARDALAAGFDGVILIVREEIQGELLDHIGSRWPADLPVEPVVQGAIAGTAQAVESARPFIDGPFGVANADDLYGAQGDRDARRRAPKGRPGRARARRLPPARHGHHRRPVTRGLCETGDDGYLDPHRRAQGAAPRRRRLRGLPDRRAGGRAAVQRLSGDEQVSMNLWGFAESMLDEIDDALDAFDPETAPHDEGKPPELLLPDVVGAAVAAGRARIRVVAVEQPLHRAHAPGRPAARPQARRRGPRRLRLHDADRAGSCWLSSSTWSSSLAEAIGGVFAHSTGLAATAGHDLADAAALGLALVATRLALRPATAARSFGYHRATILAALAERDGDRGRRPRRRRARRLPARRTRPTCTAGSS